MDLEGVMLNEMSDKERQIMYGIINMWNLNNECTGQSKHPLPTTQEKTLHRDITRWSTQKSDYNLCSQRWRSSIQSAKTRLGADCGSDHELLIAKFRLKLNKVGKTTRPFKHDL